MSAPTPVAHGGDGARLAEQLGLCPDDVLDLSASLNPVAPDLDAIVARNLGALRHYPDDTKATAAVAEMVGVDRSLLVLTNGGAEAIALLAAMAPHGRVEDPEFSLYRRHLITVDAEGLQWRSNPNNPTGVLARSDARADVWDEAFHVLATGRWSRGDADTWRLGSLTKAFACPGLRVGYAIAPHEQAAQLLRNRRPAWSVNGLATAALPAMCAMADPSAWAAAVVALRSDLVALLASHDLHADPSDANYVVVRNTGPLRDQLASHAVLVRDTASFGFDGVRLAVPDADGLARLEHALEHRP